MRSFATDNMSLENLSSGFPTLSDTSRASAVTEDVLRLKVSNFEKKGIIFSM